MLCHLGIVILNQVFGCHHPGVIDQGVKRRKPFDNVLCEKRNRIRIAFIQLAKMHARIVGTDRFQATLSAPCNDDAVSPLDKFLGEARPIPDPPPVIRTVLTNTSLPEIM